MPHQEFFSDFLAAAFAVASLFFLRFWRRTRDELFIAFALAFALLALQHVLTIFLGLPEEDSSWAYLLRLAAFTIVIITILRKNWAVDTGPAQPMGAGKHSIQSGASSQSFCDASKRLALEALHFSLAPWNDEMRILGTVSSVQS